MKTIGVVKKLFLTLHRFFSEGIDATKVKVLFGYFAVVSLLELLAYTKGGASSIIASRLWLFTALFCFGLFLYAGIKKLVEDVKQKAYFLILSFFVLVGIFCFYIGNLAYSDVNADAAQQVAAGLDSFGVADWNYTGVAFLGYPNRQYILAALPALLFGRSITTLHMGFALPFLIGLSMLFLELRNYLKDKGMNEQYALLPVYALPAFPFITEYFMNFEQAITPVALTMMGIALFLKLCRKPDVGSVIALSWVGCFYCDSYTPVLASLGLLLCFLGLYLFNLYRKHGKAIWKKQDKEKLYLGEVILGLMCNIVLFFVATMLAKRSDRMDSFREDISLREFAVEAWKEFFTDTNAVFLGIFAGIVILYIFLSVLGRLKFHDFVISCWVFGVVFFANYMVGYTSYEKAWILQRNMIVIPVLVVAIFLAAMRLLEKHPIKANKSIVCCLLLFFGLCGILNFNSEHQSFNYFRYIQPMKYMLQYAEDTLREYGIEDTEEFNLVLYTDNQFQTNVYDYAKFFYPNAHAVSFGTGAFPEGVDFTLPTFLFSEKEDVGVPFDGEVECHTFKNRRYRMEVSWYRMVVKRE